MERDVPRNAENGMVVALNKSNEIVCLHPGSKTGRSVCGRPIVRGGNIVCKENSSHIIPLAQIMKLVESNPALSKIYHQEMAELCVTNAQPENSLFKEEEITVNGGSLLRYFDEIKDFCFYPEHGEVAFVGKNHKGSCVVRNGEKGPIYEHVIYFGYTPDGKLIYGVAQPPDWFTVIDGKEQKHFNYIDQFSFRASMKGDVAYFGKVDKEAFLMLNGQQFGPLYKKLSYLAFSPAGELAYVTDDLSRQRMISRGAIGEAFEWVGEPCFSPDGEVAYIARNGKNWFIVCNGKTLEIDFVESVGELVFSQEGKLAYVVEKIAKNEKRKIVICGGKEQPFEYWMGLYFTPQGELVYGARDPSSCKCFVVRDGAVLEPEYHVQIAVSGDGKVAFVAETEDNINRGYVVCENQVEPVWGGMIRGLDFTKDNKLVYMVDGNQKRVCYGRTISSPYEEICLISDKSFIAKRGKKYFLCTCR